MARPKKYNIDGEQVQKLASFGCTNTEIASFFGCDESLIRKSYSEFITKGRQSGKIRLRQAQFRRAIGNIGQDGKPLNDGSVPMLIWLGKQILGQTEQPTLTEEDMVEGFDIPSVQSSE